MVNFIFPFRIRSLNEKVVFIGGATVSLYSERTAFEVRPTDDVDVIIELLNNKDRTELDEKLRNFGFINDIESGIICRYKIQGLIVDVMPTNDPSIGFENK
ncbi:MAG: hypothetical protein IPO33_16030 [Saprospiraceae bacterium]|nr:hypothetical protein [Candidatus Brachybacter algidus]